MYVEEGNRKSTLSERICDLPGFAFLHHLNFMYTRSTVLSKLVAKLRGLA